MIASPFGVWNFCSSLSIHDFAGIATGDDALLHANLRRAKTQNAMETRAGGFCVGCADFWRVFNRPLSSALSKWQRVIALAREPEQRMIQREEFQAERQISQVAEQWHLEDVREADERH
jgi:hypothetical protein